MKAFWWLGVHPGWLSFIIAQLDILKSCPSLAQKMPKTRMANKFKKTKHTHTKKNRIRYNCLSTEENIVQISWWEHLSRDSHREVNPPGGCVCSRHRTDTWFVAAAKEILSLDLWIGCLRCPIFLDKCLKNKETKSLSVSWASCNQTLHC